MINISAGGFAFATEAEKFADVVGRQIEITIRDFDLLGEAVLKGIAIRSSDDEGRYVVGCRMPADNMKIKDYVQRRMESSRQGRVALMTEGHQRLFYALCFLANKTLNIVLISG